MTRYVPHLLVYISGHGFGHVAQTAPVLNRLRQLLPELRLTICSTAPATHLQSRIPGEFTHIPRAVDFGMVMASALDVLAQESLHAYCEFHRDWDARVAREAEHIAALKPDAVLSNVAYLPLAAARQAGVSCAAMCSLNWADILAHYCGDMSGAAEILAQMREAYARADVFLRVTPGMLMADLPNLRPIDPIARLGTKHRAGIDHLLGLKNSEKLVLISMGGIATRLPMESWPEIENVRWLVQADWEVSRADVSTLESLSMDFTDVLASCDALLCKPGYGSFAEAACNGVPVLYVSRHDWPEEACLVEWLAQHGRCVEVGRKQLEEGDLCDALTELLGQQPRPDAAAPRGIDQAADYLRSSIENC
jgi:UDP:flavonoid glycosyltransferase YjiC (YdhE family)